jgi:hypothetical protein
LDWGETIRKHKYENNMRNKLFPCALAFAACAIFALTPALAQNSDRKDVLVEVRHDSKDSKSVPLTQETEKWWFFTVEAGYNSKYMFRGTDLTPNSDGIAFEDVRLSVKGFTIGVWAAQQIGEAVVLDATGVGEAGGGGIPRLDISAGFGLPPGSIITRDTAIQKSFRELDLYASYFHSFGWLDVTVGNIAFFIDRRQVDRTDFLFVAPFQAFNFSEDHRSIGDETFDRVFITLSTHKLPCHIVPSLTYYQTVYNEGDGGEGIGYLFFERNSELGGYLEGKVSASIPIVKDRLSLDPTALISYSFDDRNESTGLLVPSSLPFTGLHHFQAGAELTWRVTDHISVVAFGNYAHRFSEPTAGGEKNTVWGGGKVSLSF